MLINCSLGNIVHYIYSLMKRDPQILLYTEFKKKQQLFENCFKVFASESSISLFIILLLL